MHFKILVLIEAPPNSIPWIDALSIDDIQTYEQAQNLFHAIRAFCAVWPASEPLRPELFQRFNAIIGDLPSLDDADLRSDTLELDEVMPWEYNITPA